MYSPDDDTLILFSVVFFHLSVDVLLSLLQVQDLEDASEDYGTLNNILDYDVEMDTVKSHGSLSRNLRRVRQGLDLIRALFQNFLSSEYVSFVLVRIHKQEVDLVTKWCS